MNTKVLAAALNGIKYPCYIPKALTNAAKEHGLVIVFGASNEPNCRGIVVAMKDLSA